MTPFKKLNYSLGGAVYFEPIDFFAGINTSVKNACTQYIKLKKSIPNFPVFFLCSEIFPFKLLPSHMLIQKN